MLKKQALTIGVYDSSYIMQASPFCGDDVFANGLERNGYSVTRFDYRGTKTPNEDLITLASSLPEEPDVVWIGKAERISPETIERLRSLFPSAKFVKWAADVRETQPTFDLLHNDHVDWFFGTFGGDYLKGFLRPGMTGVSSILAFTDSEYYRPIEVETAYESDILWTGRRSVGDNHLRNEVIDYLSSFSEKEMTKVADTTRLVIRLFGHDGKQWLQDDYVKFINGAKIGIGVNSFKRTLYSSDRLGNYMSCGTFFLSERIEGMENFLEDGKEIAYFDDVIDMHKKMSLYLSDHGLRYKIAEAGRDKILKNYDAKPLVSHLLDVIQTNENGRSWEETHFN